MARIWEDEIEEERIIEFFGSIPMPIKNVIDEMFSIAPWIVDWMFLKRRLLNMLCNEFQRYFSTRNYYDRLQYPNKMEFEIMRYWVSLSKRQFVYVEGGVTKYIDVE